MRNRIVLLALCLVLAACDETGQTGGSVAERQGALVQATAAAGTPSQLAYSHRLAIESAPAGVAPRFERARDACLAAANTGCVLLAATIETGDSGRQLRPHASLQLRLPHDAVEPFIKSLLEPLPGETKANAGLRSRSTTADDLSRTIADTERRLKQLMDYRDRLTMLAARPDAKLDELIKVESELSTLQSQIEQLTGEQRALNERAATERLTVDISADASFDSVTRPIVTVWHNGRAVLGDNAASALRFGIGALPWLPLIVIAVLFLRGLRPLLAGRRKPAAA